MPQCTHCQKDKQSMNVLILEHKEGYIHHNLCDLCYQTWKTKRKKPIASSRFLQNFFKRGREVVTYS